MSCSLCSQGRVHASHAQRQQPCAARHPVLCDSCWHVPCNRTAAAALLCKLGCPTSPPPPPLLPRPVTRTAPALSAGASRLLQGPSCLSRMTSPPFRRYWVHCPAGWLVLGAQLRSWAGSTSCWHRWGGLGEGGRGAAEGATAGTGGVDLGGGAAD